MNDPSRMSESYTQMARQWALPHALMGGTQGLQQAGSQFLPRHPAENEAVYRERAKRTVLRNYFRRTVHKLVGRAFSSPLIASEDMPPQLQNLLKNIDLMGRGLNAFAQSWFQDALVSGLSHVLVDFPVQGSFRSLAEQRNGNLRPYAVHIPADQLIGVQWQAKGDGHRLSQIRIREKNVVYTGFEESRQEQIRVVTPDNWEIYRQDNRGRWRLAEQGENSLGEIPLVTLYTNRTGFMQASPPLEDLAYLNLEHYQIRSDQRNALNVASFPILAASGYDPEIDGPIEVGPNKVLTTSDTDGNYYYVESSGAALEAGARELADLEKAIQLFGLQFEAIHAGETATGRALDAADAVTPLYTMMMNMEDSLNSLLKLFGKWSGIDAVGAIEVPTARLSDAGRDGDVAHLLSMRQMGVISDETLHREITNRGILQDGLAFNGAAD